MTVRGLCRCPLGSAMVLRSARPEKGPHITVRVERAAGRTEGGPLEKIMACFWPLPGSVLTRGLTNGPCRAVLG